MGFFGELLLGIGASVILGTCEIKFDVLFNNEDEKNNFFKLLNKWNEIFQRKNLLVDPEKSKVDIYNQLEKISLSINRNAFREWESSDPENRPDTATRYTKDGKTLTILSNYDNQKYTSILSVNAKILHHSLGYKKYGIFWQPNNKSELGFVFNCFNLDSNSDDLKSVLYLYFKNSETCISSAALLTIVKRGVDTSNHIFREQELGLENLLTILNSHDVYEHLEEFLKQPYSFSEARIKEIEEQNYIATKKAELFEKMKKEKDEIIKKQQEIERMKKEEADKKAKFEAINALENL